MAHARPSLDPHSSLPKGPSLLARKYLATHLGSPFVEEQIHGLLQEDPLSKAALLKAKQLADSKLK
ncbi:MAG: hypothetical protein KatS3mg087_0163 [Patescibacteria group bacterium]|nr:MAG: hypothetical protein KatS3mg087_0163 [Patescibacteria group bacterium]